MDQTTHVVLMQGLDDPEPREVEVYADGTPVDVGAVPGWATPVPEEPTVTVTRAELADMIATATAAAVAAHTDKTDTAAVRAAALSAIEDKAI